MKYTWLLPPDRTEAKKTCEEKKKKVRKQRFSFVFAACDVYSAITVL